MVEEKNKIIVASIVIAIFLVILGCFLFVDIPILGVNSIKTILAQHDNIIAKEAQLVSKQNQYKTLESNLIETKKTFESEKAKYEAISDETVKIIKDSNIEENYSLEYMWIRLGNYASKNNLSLVMVEPGNVNGMTTENTSTTNTTTKDESLVDNTNNSNTEDTSNNSATSGALQIQVTGSYIDLSDFIFEVENDKELNFKLDNILMEYVSGNTVKTTFDVKNIIINK